MITVHRAVAKVRNRELWILAEDWPTQSDTIAAARLAARWMGPSRKQIWCKWRADIAEVLDVDLERPYGCDLRLLDKPPA